MKIWTKGIVLRITENELYDLIYVLFFNPKKKVLEFNPSDFSS